MNKLEVGKKNLANKVGGETSITSGYPILPGDRAAGLATKTSEDANDHSFATFQECSVDGFIALTPCYS